MYQQHKSDDLEAGGILIGRILEENNHFIIDDASAPMPQDTWKRKSFKRCPEGHQLYFDTVWEETGGRCFYLGEWHTHPEKDPTPSYVDIREWKRIIHLENESDTMFFIIVGTKRVRVWHGDRKTKQITGLRGRIYVTK
ncbi:Mov34/MPN/PAD-1 family protein [Brevibacillus laterosporus]|uniref:Mov34/MPN/PAD-1 family protein n=1 Tax=Brevibacillus laterosporus TaxID=1465 RepID=UPI0009DAB5B4|nr:Mov34/MPN/PAD-1 family protein [Brevibacillus laterosporus]